MAGGEFTALLEAVSHGDRAALDRAFSLVYEELKRLAHGQRRRAGSDTLSTTGLVHETYLKFLRAEAVDASGRDHFYRLAARAMRQVLLDRARIEGAARRPQQARRAGLDEVEHALGDVAAIAPDELIDLDRALRHLEDLDPRLAEVAQLHLFAGLEFAELAALRGVSERTVLRDWRKARAVLVSRLDPCPGAA